MSLVRAVVVRGCFDIPDPRAIGEQGRLERRGARGIAARNWNRARIRRVHVGGDVELGSIEFERFERLGLLKVVEAP
jgi:hypothetical protein